MAPKVALLATLVFAMLSRTLAKDRSDAQVDLQLEYENAKGKATDAKTSLEALAKKLDDVGTSDESIKQFGFKILDIANTSVPTRTEIEHLRSAERKTEEHVRDLAREGSEAAWRMSSCARRMKRARQVGQRLVDSNESVSYHKMYKLHAKEAKDLQDRVATLSDAAIDKNEKIYDKLQKIFNVASERVERKHEQEQREQQETGERRNKERTRHIDQSEQENQDERVTREKRNKHRNNHVKQADAETRGAPKGSANTTAKSNGTNDLQSAPSHPALMAADDSKTGSRAFVVLIASLGACLGAFAVAKKTFRRRESLEPATYYLIA